MKVLFVNLFSFCFLYKKTLLLLYKQNDVKMGFQNIHIQNFRSIKDLKIDGFKQINLFAGKNNDGKTTILESIFVLAGATNPELSLSINGLRDYEKMREDDFIILFHNLNHKRNIILNGIENNGQKRNLNISPIYKNTIKQNIHSSSLNRAIKGLLNTFEVENKERSLIFDTEIIVSHENSNIHIDTDEVDEKGYIENLEAIFLSSSIQLESVAERLNSIILNKEKKDIVAIIQKLDSSIGDLYIDDDIIYIDTGLQRFIPIHVAGDGLKRLLSIITAIYNAKNGIILIDEVDNGLHFSVQQLLWKAIITAAKQFNVQIFATTHSIECLAALNTAAQTFKQNKNIIDDEIRYFRIERNNDTHKIYTYEQEIFKLAMEKNWEVR